MDCEIDTDLLISLVESKPVLWDKSLEDYKSRNLTSSAWMDVCYRLSDDFEHLNDKEKNDFGRLVYKRWRNVKDNWIKAQRKVVEQKKAGSGVKAAKNYIYYEQMSFLKKNLDAREPEESFTGKNGTTEVEEEEEEEEEQQQTDGGGVRASRESDAASSNNKGSNKRKRSDREERIIKTAVEAPESRHLSFCKGIMPSLEKLTDDETIQFQLGVLNLLQNIRQVRSLPQPLHSDSQQPPRRRSWGCQTNASVPGTQVHSKRPHQDDDTEDDDDDLP